MIAAAAQRTSRIRLGTGVSTLSYHHPLTLIDRIIQLTRGRLILGDGEASPAPLNLHDLLRRWHDGSTETQRLIYQWGRTAAPEALRPYFDHDRATIQTAADLVLKG